MFSILFSKLTFFFFFFFFFFPDISNNEINDQQS